MICRIVLRAVCLGAAGLFAVCQAGGKPVQQREPRVVEVAADASLEQVFRDLSATAKKAGMPRECAFAWGQVDKLSDRARPARLEWGKDKRIEGWLVPDTDMTALTKQPAVRQVGILSFEAGELRVSHPSGPGSRVLPADAKETPESKKERERTFGLFDTPEDAAKVPADKVLPRLQGATRFFRFVLWELAPGMGADK